METRFLASFVRTADTENNATNFVISGQVREHLIMNSGVKRTGQF
jgi:hypothetical protein